MALTANEIFKGRYGVNESGRINGTWNSDKLVKRGKINKNQAYEIVRRFDDIGHQEGEYYYLTVVSYVPEEDHFYTERELSKRFESLDTIRNFVDGLKNEEQTLNILNHHYSLLQEAENPNAKEYARQESIYKGAKAFYQRNSELLTYLDPAYSKELDLKLGQFEDSEGNYKQR
ncbi:polyhydroxyalkanoate synthesis regulator phasin [Paenibacillus sp. LBL]|uniref:hypothetical protein n=1 Tax=Paenibacillus sp. LBL TaxID=2940563 RepID=UPI002476FB9A|nr:hypothetical protein [Paenibacillus sp. LBL]MDH6674387.1 polyhydroxyalkanoate synthesis regulator phasin [Paenibacillus sp. LBL]